MRRELHGLNGLDRLAARIEELARRKRRRPPESGVPAMAVPPKGPRPLAGGAAAALEFDD